MRTCRFQLKAEQKPLFTYYLTLDNIHVERYLVRLEEASSANHRSPGHGAERQSGTSCVLCVASHAVTLTTVENILCNDITENLSSCI